MKNAFTRVILREVAQATHWWTNDAKKYRVSSKMLCGWWKKKNHQLSKTWLGGLNYPSQSEWWTTHFFTNSTPLDGSIWREERPPWPLGDVQDVDAPPSPSRQNHVSHLPLTLKGPAHAWFGRLKLGSIDNILDLSKRFVSHFIKAQSCQKPVTYLLNVK